VIRLAVGGGVLALLLVACGGNNASAIDGTTWKFFAYDIGAGVTDKLADTEPTVFFEDGKVSGSDGCNDFTGSYELSTGNMIEIGPLASTQKACAPEVMAQADTIMMLLGEAILYEKSDGRLIFRTLDARYSAYDE
jgi:heat shock protein HslJ